jgi:hypothetical protein
MKLDHDKVRKFLIAIEDSTDIHGLSEVEANRFAKENDLNREELAYMVTKLSEGDLITGNVKWAGNRVYWINPGNLTYSGHEYLDNIRDDKVWAAVKKTGKGLASMSLSIAVELGKAKLREMVGLPPA